MKTKHLGHVLAGIELLILGGIVLHTPLSVGLGMLFPDISLLFKVWKELLLGIGLVVAIIIIGRQGKWKLFLDDLVVRLAAAYALLHVVLFGLMWRGLDASLAGLLIDLRYVLLFVLVYVTIRLFPGYRKLFVGVALAGAMVVTGFAVLQVTVLPSDVLKHIGYSQSTILPYLTVDLNQEFIRINSTLRGPNPLGAYAGICLALIAAYVTQYRRAVSRMNIAVLAVVAMGAMVALWASYSRSAVVAAVVMLVAVMVASSGLRVSRMQWIVGASVAFALVGGIFAARDTAFVSNVLLHENPAGGSVEKSNEGHIESLNDGLRRVSTQPFGEGIGSTGSASLRSDEPHIIENQYLAIAHETGWLGLGLFIWLFGLILGRLWQRRDDWLALGMLASGIGLALIGLLLPVWMDDTVSLVWWGLAAVALVPLTKEKIHGKKRQNH